MERWAISLAKKHPAWFAEYILGLVPTAFHIEWQDLCSRYSRLLLFAPLEHGKSTQLSIIRVLWELGINPDLRIAVISDTEIKAKKWVSLVRANIESNPLVRKVFPDLVPEDRPGYVSVWSDERFNVRRSSLAAFTEADNSLRAFGRGGALGGSRFDLIICDDILDFENSRTAAGRQTTDDWYRSPEGPLSRCVKNGRIIDIGTAWHEDDYRHRIEKNLKEFHVVRYQAGVGICHWPEAWSAERLEAKRAEGALEFARQFLNIPFGEATGYLPSESARRCQELCEDPTEYWMGQIPKEAMRWVTAGLDIGGTFKEGGARAALCVLGMGADGFKRPLHLRSGMWVGMTLFEEVVQVWRIFGHVLREQIVESNAQQIHLVSLLSDEAIVNAVAIKLGIPAEEAKRLAAKIAGSTSGLYTTKIVHREDVRWGIRGLGPEIEALKWRFPQGQPEIEHLFEDMRRYDPEAHPGDRLVALYLAHAKMLGQGTPIRNMARSRSVRDLQ